MNATRILWGQILAVYMIALAFVWAATQRTAAQLGYATLAAFAAEIERQTPGRVHALASGALARPNNRRSLVPVG